MDFECTPDEFHELKALLDRHLAVYSLRGGSSGRQHVTEGYCWITAEKAACSHRLGSGRRIPAVMRAGGIASKKIGPRVFYEQTAVDQLYSKLALTLSLEDASYELGFTSSRSLRRYIASGVIQATKIAGLTRIPWSEIDRLEEQMPPLRLVPRETVEQ